MIRCSDCGNRLDWFFVCPGCGMDETPTDTDVVLALRTIVVNMVREAQEFAHENGMDQYDRNTVLGLVGSSANSLIEEVLRLAGGFLDNLEPIDPESQLAPVPPGLRELFEAERRQTGGMEPNPNGHRYGCECSECMDYYRSLK